MSEETGQAILIVIILSQVSTLILVAWMFGKLARIIGQILEAALRSSKDHE